MPIRGNAPAPAGPGDSPSRQSTLPRLTRSSQGRVVAGVAQGLATHLGIGVLPVRVAFAVLTILGGAGVVLYAAFWAVVPQGGHRVTGARPRRRNDVGQSLALGALAVGLFLLLQSFGLFGGGSFVFPALLIGAGVALVWRQADDTQRARWTQMTTRLPWAMAGGESRQLAAMRLVGGGVLVLAGMAAFVIGTGQFDQAVSSLVPALVIVIGIVVITGPWWWRIGSELSAERRERIRSQERADVAAHLHDSVLQTLALIQRHSESPREVARLARSQERELRAWLYRPLQQQPDTQFAAALERAAAEVEDTYGVTVEPVVVGDADLDERLEAVVAAAREALVNAAKHAKVGDVSLYAEVQPDEVSVFIRDRGVGFDPATVPDGHHGLAGSVVGRMDRHGGTATVRSSPDAGTEVELTMGRGS